MKRKHVRSRSEDVLLLINVKITSYLFITFNKDATIFYSLSLFNRLLYVGQCFFIFMYEFRASFFVMCDRLLNTCLNLFPNFPVNCPFFFFAPAHKRCLSALCDAEITSAIVQLCGLVRQPCVSMETQFRGQHIADVLCCDVKML